MPPKFDRCVKKVKRKGRVKNPHAVCTVALKKGKKSGQRKKKKK